MKCSGSPELFTLATASFQVAPSNIAPVAIAPLTSFAPCSNTRPAPSALWPTSLLPMSPSVGMPTALPWATSSALGVFAARWSRVGVRASQTASDSSFRP